MKFETSLKEIIPRTSDVSSFRFPRPNGLEYKAGQYMLVNIKSGDKELLHAFSFSSSPTEKDFIEFTKKFTPNEYSVTLSTLKLGNWARIDAPYGKFTFEGEYPKVALLTGGIGITPFRSIIKYCTDKHVDSSIFLFHGCRTPRDFAFQTDLEQMQKKNPNLHLVFTANEPDSAWTGSVGNITPDLVKREMPDFAERVYFACGPPGMIQAMTNLVKQLGLPESQLKLESFAGYT
jgi:glycine betaine catabolism B